MSYEAEFEFDVPASFGVVGAVLVTNEHHHKEMFLVNVKLTATADGGGADDLLLAIQCKSWIQPRSHEGNAPVRRAFFANKRDLEQKRGDGRGERKDTDRVYDYDVYNDLASPGEPRPALGGSKQFPYPRRCRTGRPPFPEDTASEMRSADTYVPRDEGFSEAKLLQLASQTLRTVLPAAVPAVRPTRVDRNQSFSSFSDIDKLFEDGIKLPHGDLAFSCFFLLLDKLFADGVNLPPADKLSILRVAVSLLEEWLRDGPAPDDQVLPDKPANVCNEGKIAGLRDEEFTSGILAGANPHAMIKLIKSTHTDPNHLEVLSSFVNKLFEDGDQLGFLRGVVPSLLQILQHGPGHQVLRFDTPANVQKDKFGWLRDEEFARETLAGVNPYAIELVREFPLKSKLDPAVYGPAESAITAEVLERQMGHVMTAAEAVKQKRLFMLDYHDLFLPYVHKIRAQEHTTMYGSRTVFFLTGDGTLRLLAIELTRPASPSQPQWRRVFTPSTDTTESCLWRMAKSHVRAHDSGHHELVSHWLRTHCAVEPYVIAANRQLSEMHPIYQLLRPHFRYTMRINALARSALINAGGIIELTFSPGKHAMELTSAAYDKLWRFDTEALPADLVRRGMAEEDPTAEHGLRLAIQDYPFANDGLLIWDAIKGWVEAYVARFYTDAGAVAGDAELQAFWAEVIEVGHGDKKDAPGWPALNTPASLAHALATIVWVASAHHAAVNAGQYDFGGYFPNRPSIARTRMPVEEPVDGEAFAAFLDDPDQALRECFPSQVQATLVMAVLDLLSTHSPDEEYLGGMEAAPWNDDAGVRAAYGEFNERLKEIEGIIDRRNADRRLKNRCGAGIVPYQLMKPSSQPGLIGKGIPNSTAI
ncbi:unnamed protein product [Urochloa decumbens]|uniref:Lipoxygenase n=1 Tax=Urochloa decumbens TaxID=240449 RepID=A0ABC9BP90_9POAL